MSANLKKLAAEARRDLLRAVGARLRAARAELSIERREFPALVVELDKAAERAGEAALIERVAYAWFNRLSALRFMDLRGYNRPTVVSPPAGRGEPEILVWARRGEIDPAMVADPQKRERISALLSGTYTHENPAREAYRLLLTGACNYWAKVMPYVFGRVDDYISLLAPADLLSPESVRGLIMAAITAESAKDVEIIGWLYQYYIAEKKDEIFASKSKVEARDIPAATQLFTPNWIARYLLENSLGRLWMQNKPASELAEAMPYYVKPDAVDDAFPRLKSPEEIKLCDPACGSGHMLVYAFDLLWRIYEEAAYDAEETVENIIKNNLYGMEIDPRAAALAGFALAMKAREKDRRFFERGIKPNILCYEDVVLGAAEAREFAKKGRGDILPDAVLRKFDNFLEASHFGSLLRPGINNAGEIRAKLQERGAGRDIGASITQDSVLKILEMAEYLEPRYQVVAANPPYMGGRGMNGRLGAWLKENYPKTRADLFAAFMERGLELAVPAGYCAMVTMQSWMFLSSYKDLRAKLLDKYALRSMAHVGARGFDDIGGEVVSTTAYVAQNVAPDANAGVFLRLVEGRSEKEKEKLLFDAIKNPDSACVYRAKADDFKKIPGSPLAYWLSEKIRNIFATNKPLGEIAEAKVGLQTSDNDRFLRLWHEVSFDKIGFGKKSSEEAKESGLKWFPHNKGGEFRKWYGNHEFIVNWENDGEEIKNYKDDTGKLLSRPQNTESYFKESISWGDITSQHNAFKFYPEGFIFDTTGMSDFWGDYKDKLGLLVYANSQLFYKLANSINATFHFSIGYFNQLPYAEKLWSYPRLAANAEELIAIAKEDWDSSETSWNFTTHPLLKPEFRGATLEQTYQNLRAHWRQMTDRTRALEEENNRIIIEAYDLADELTPDVPLNEISLFCNPAYRFRGEKTEEELEKLLLAETMASFVSYAMGRAFGRYSPDAPGLVIASQNQNLAEKFPGEYQPVRDNVIPAAGEDRFPDDAANLFLKFLRETFGEENFAANRKFVEAALGKFIRAWFPDAFYADHLRRYNKRPIYWLFQSPGGAFSAFVYAHRFEPETVGRAHNRLREYVIALETEAADARALAGDDKAKPAARTRALKKENALRKALRELEDYERDVLYPLASARRGINLDDGMRVNYAKFARALKKIPGMEKKG